MNLGIHVASVLRIEVYLPDKPLVWLPNQTRISQGLAGSRAAVHCWWNIPSVLLKSNLWERSSAHYCHPHPSYTARGHSGSSPQGHNSPKAEAAPAATSTEQHQSDTTPPSQRGKVPFPSHTCGFWGWMLLQKLRCFLRASLQRTLLLLMATWAKGTSNAMLSSDHSGIKNLKSIPKSQCTLCYTGIMQSLWPDNLGGFFFFFFMYFFCYSTSSITAVPFLPFLYSASQIGTIKARKNVFMLQEFHF